MVYNPWLKRKINICFHDNNKGRSWYISKCLSGQCSEFVSCKGEHLYLHEDGIWRETTQNIFGFYTGYYQTREDAKEVLDRSCNNL